MSNGAGRGSMVNAAMLRLSHCQTALFGNRGGGSGGGGLLPVSLSPAREECSEPAADTSPQICRNLSVFQSYRALFANA